MMEGHINIREMSEMFGVTLRTLRHYEDKGIISPKRLLHNERAYGEREIARMKIAVQLTGMGFTLKEVVESLDMLTSKMSRSEIYVALHDKFSKQKKVLNDRRDEIAKQMRSVRRYSFRVFDEMMENANVI